jgi:hypothetical protein
MSAQPLPKFDSGEYEALLTDAGVEKSIAQAHRKGVALSQEYLVTNAELELKFAQQNAMLRQALLDQARWIVGAVAAIVGIATAILKLPG